MMKKPAVRMAQDKAFVLKHFPKARCVVTYHDAPWHSITNMGVTGSGANGRTEVEAWHYAAQATRYKVERDAKIQQAQ